MSRDEGLAERLRDALAGIANVIEKKMFSGLCFLVEGNMFCKLVDEILTPRVGPER